MAESDVYCNVVMNLGEVNISNKVDDTSTKNRKTKQIIKHKK